MYGRTDGETQALGDEVFTFCSVERGKDYFIGFDGLIAVVMTFANLWDIAPCSLYMN
jgi:hypothetical protein